MCVELCDHTIDCGVLGFEAERRHGSFEFARVNSTITISIEESKGFPNLLNLILSETWSLEDSPSDG